MLSNILKFAILSSLASYVFLQATLDVSGFSKEVKIVVDVCWANLTNLKDEQIHKLLIARKKPTTQDEKCFLACMFKQGHIYDPKNDSFIADQYRKRIKARNVNNTEPDFKAKMEILDLCENKVNFIENDDCENVSMWITCCCDAKDERNVTSKMW